MSVTKTSQLDPGVLLWWMGCWAVCVLWQGSLGGHCSMGGGKGYEGLEAQEIMGRKEATPDPQVRLGLSKYAQQAQTIFKVKQYEIQKISSKLS